MSQLVGPAQWRAQPWKNGGGVTYEIARWPAGDGDYDVRVSFAEVVAAGPFSTFPGYRRWTTRLDDVRLGLETPDGLQWLARGVATALDGATPITAHVPDGPARVVNVLARPGLIEVGTGASAAPVQFVFAMSPSGGLGRWDARVGEPAELPAGDVVWVRWLGGERR